jgi:hypothetical protein
VETDAAQLDELQVAHVPEPLASARFAPEAQDEEHSAVAALAQHGFPV